jgi:putative FmdB family regulatory protein
MPSYEFICENGHTYTEVRSIHEDQKVFKCPECDAELKRVFESTPVSFRAGGFYANERRREFGI